MLPQRTPAQGIAVASFRTWREEFRGFERTSFTDTYVKSISSQPSCHPLPGSHVFCAEDFAPAHHTLRRVWCVFDFRSVTLRAVRSRRPRSPPRATSA